MKRTSMIALAVAAAATAGCADLPPGLGSSLDGGLDPAAGMTGPGVPLSSGMDVPSPATMQFGLEAGDVGSPFPPTHDRSFHSYVAVHPRTVVIAAGGEVTFEMAAKPPHSLSIYDVGKTTDDVDLTNVVDDLIIDPGDLLFSTEITTTDQTVQFDAPGRYLVICRVLRHFVHSNMYGWVIVK